MVKLIYCSDGDDSKVLYGKKLLISSTMEKKIEEDLLIPGDKLIYTGSGFWGFDNDDRK